MCSSLVQIVFNILLLIGIVLTTAAFFSPGWVKVDGPQSVGSIRKGLVTMTCNNQTGSVSQSSVQDCAGAIWNKLNDKERTTFVCLILSILVCVIAFVYSLILCCCLCFCRSCLAFPLPILVGVGCLLDIIAIAVYAASNPSIPTVDFTSTNGVMKFGESMWVGVAAIVVLALDTVIGGIMVKLGKVSPV